MLPISVSSTVHFGDPEERYNKKFYSVNGPVCYSIRFQWMEAELTGTGFNSEGDLLREEVSKVEPCVGQND